MYINNETGFTGFTTCKGTLPFEMILKKIIGATPHDCTRQLPLTNSLLLIK